MSGTKKAKVRPRKIDEPTFKIRSDVIVPGDEYEAMLDEIERLRAALRDVYIYIYNYANGLEDNLGDLQDIIWESGLLPKEELQELHDKYSGEPIERRPDKPANMTEGGE